MEHDPERHDELQAAAHAYVGGVLTTLRHLDLVTEEEHTDWNRRLVGRARRSAGRLDRRLSRPAGPAEPDG